jgi:predicted DNA-binding transcriptional regulator AlpA
MAGTESLSRPLTAGSEFMNTAQVAEWIGIPAGTLRNWRHRNIGPASFKIGLRVAYRRASVAAWIAAQELATRRGGVEEDLAIRCDRGE